MLQLYVTNTSYSSRFMSASVTSTAITSGASGGPDAEYCTASSGTKRALTASKAAPLGDRLSASVSCTLSPPKAPAAVGLDILARPPCRARNWPVAPTRAGPP